MLSELNVYNHIQTQTHTQDLLSASFNLFLKIQNRSADDISIFIDERCETNDYMMYVDSLVTFD